jgi:hypothetical protein
MSKKELWKPIKGYEGCYEVSSIGRVKSLSRRQKHPSGSFFLKRERILSPSKTKGYQMVSLKINGLRKSFLVHQLVAVAFLGHSPDGHKTVVDHINNDKLDNRLCNLQLISQRENASKDSKRKYSSFLGVTWNHTANKWMSQITVSGKNKYLGVFEDEIEAANAYNLALEKILE